jgi:hypothetical protein
VVVETVKALVFSNFAEEIKKLVFSPIGSAVRIGLCIPVFVNVLVKRAVETGSKR